MFDIAGTRRHLKMKKHAVRRVRMRMPMELISCVCACGPLHKYIHTYMHTTNKLDPTCLACWCYGDAEAAAALYVYARGKCTCHAARTLPLTAAQSCKGLVCFDVFDGVLSLDNH